jgi:hypothetical protein
MNDLPLIYRGDYLFMQFSQPPVVTFSAGKNIGTLIGRTEAVNWFVPLKQMSKIRGQLHGDESFNSAEGP